MLMFRPNGGEACGWEGAPSAAGLHVLRRPWHPAEPARALTKSRSELAIAKPRSDDALVLRRLRTVLSGASPCAGLQSPDAPLPAASAESEAGPPSFCRFASSRRLRFASLRWLSLRVQLLHALQRAQRVSNADMRSGRWERLRSVQSVARSSYAWRATGQAAILSGGSPPPPPRRCMKRRAGGRSRTCFLP